MHVRFVCMKMKRLQALLSIVSVLHLLLLASGGAFINEFLKNVQNKGALLAFGGTLFLISTILIVLYFYLILKTSNKKK